MQRIDVKMLADAMAEKLDMEAHVYETAKGWQWHVESVLGDVKKHTMTIHVRPNRATGGYEASVRENGNYLQLPFGHSAIVHDDDAVKAVVQLHKNIRGAQDKMQMLVWLIIS